MTLLSYMWVFPFLLLGLCNGVQAVCRTVLCWPFNRMLYSSSADFSGVAVAFTPAGERPALPNRQLTEPRELSTCGWAGRTPHDCLLPFPFSS